MALRFDSEVIKDSRGRIPYKILHSGGREHFNLRIRLNGPGEELDQVERVDYTLHPSFRKRNLSSTERDNGFGISIWTWGMFAIQSMIYYKSGEGKSQEFYLSYDLPEDDGTNYLLLTE